jgi:uncharacterized LabA/DUF88 family protein
MLNMDLYKEQRICILVDVQNMYYSARNLYDCKVNFLEILKDALKNRKLVRAIAYVIRADVKDEPIFHEALEKIGFEVKSKDLLIFHGGHKKGDWDIGIAMDAVRAAEKADTIVVVSGDGDFKELYEYVRGKGCRIEVMAFGKTASSSIKDYVDDFIDLDKNKKYLLPLKPGTMSSFSSQNKSSSKKGNTSQSKKGNTLSNKNSSSSKQNVSSKSKKNSLPPENSFNNKNKFVKESPFSKKTSFKTSSGDTSKSNNVSNKSSAKSLDNNSIKPLSKSSEDLSADDIMKANNDQPTTPKINSNIKVNIPNPIKKIMDVIKNERT